MIEFIVIATIVLGLVAVVLIGLLIMPYKPSQRAMDLYIQKMEKGGKLK